ncbi:MAG: NAD(P)H-binding protein, partial [Myxococcota bacterium]
MESSPPRETLKLIVFGATGGLGQSTWRAAVDAGHEVVAFVRSPGKLDASDPRHGRLQVVQGDVMDADAVRAACAGARVAINCTSPAGGNSTLELAQSVVTNATAAGVEAVYMVGGLGALWAPGTNRSVLLQDWDDADAMGRYGLSAAMPREQIRRMTKGHLAAMAFMQDLGVRHCFVCPGMMVEGSPSDRRVVTLDELGGTAAMRVTYADVAQVIVDD